MQELDRLVWADGLVLSIQGVRIGVRSNSASFLNDTWERLRLCCRPLRSPDVDYLYSAWIGEPTSRRGVRNLHVLYGNALRLERTPDVHQLLEVLETQIHRLAATACRRSLFVHAGVVSVDRRAIVIPGLSHAGKSHLVGALMRAGATYFSDEYAVFDAMGRVHPYPKALSLRSDDGGPPTRVDVESAEDGAGRRALPVGLVVVTSYRPGTRWRPRQLSAGQAVLELLANTVLARERPTVALQWLAQAVRPDTTCVKGARGDADFMVPSVLRYAGIT